MINLNNKTDLNEAKFDGSNYDAKNDKRRLTGQILRIFEAIKDSGWYTLDEIHIITRDPHASISAQLRNLRKDRFGAHTVDKRSRNDRSIGLWEYKLIVSDGSNQLDLL
mgnify:CR=1 FL=1|tara:strand:+ start:87 stop:413 length:327 start_codon:yes stop_codon:yes gene_type:complete